MRKLLSVHAETISGEIYYLCNYDVGFGLTSYKTRWNYETLTDEEKEMFENRVNNYEVWNGYERRYI